MPLTDGETIAGYTIVRMLGAGGMGEVYLAQHPRLPRQDALKVLSTTVCADSEYRERFNREADIAATLWHPHIVAVHDRGEYDGHLWISMDYVDGHRRRPTCCAERYPDGMPPDDVVRIVTAVAEALDYAHQRGLLHRDVKPANILMADPGPANERIMLADFGIARTGRRGQRPDRDEHDGGHRRLRRTRTAHGRRTDRRPRRPVRVGGHRVPAADRVAAVSAFQPGGRHQPAPDRAAARRSPCTDPNCPRWVRLSRRRWPSRRQTASSGVWISLVPSGIRRTEKGATAGRRCWRPRRRGPAMRSGRWWRAPGDAHRRCWPWCWR